jgi:excisionase family DNA binding protein
MKKIENIEDRLWTVKDVAHYLGVSVNTIYAWRAEGVGPVGRRVGKHVRFHPADVRQWFANQPERVA